MQTTQFRSMGGTVELQLPDKQSGESAAIEALFARHERTLSRFLPDSELCALNSAGPGPFAASPLLFDVIGEALRWARITDGIFDPTVIDVLESSGYDRTFDRIGEGGATVVVTPPAEQHANWRAIELDPERRSISMPRGTRLDLGGIGKGYAVDRAIEALGPGVNAMVNASGDLYAAGDGPDGDGWYVGVQDPCAMDRDLVVLHVNDRAVATSGSIKRSWSVGDARYHHLIDPRESKSSPSDLISVTAVAPTATQADVMAKTVFLLGSRSGLRAVEPFAGVECMAVTAAGDVLTTPGMREHYA